MTPLSGFGASCPFGEADAVRRCILMFVLFHNCEIATFDDISFEEGYSGARMRRRAVVACNENE